MKLLVLVLVALSLSCSDRVAEPQVDMSHYMLRSEAFAIDSANCYNLYWHLTNEYDDCFDFANWVKKKYPDVWHEYYATVCDTGKG